MKGYYELWQRLLSKASQATGAGQDDKGTRIRRLADVCSMMLAPESINEPFKPYAVMNGKRSAIPDDFSADDLKYFSRLAQKTKCALLRARLADMVWLRGKPRNRTFAFLAIDAYRNIPLDYDSLVGGGAKEAWLRAIKLALLLGNGAGERPTHIRAALLLALNGCTENERFRALWLSQLLAEIRVDLSEAAAIAQKLNELSTAFDRKDEFDVSRAYYDAASKWCVTSKDNAGRYNALKSLAESWAREATLKSSEPTPSFTAAAEFFEKAIHTYRRIPMKDRPVHNVDSRLSQLHTLMSAAGLRAVDEMTAIHIPTTINVEETVANSQSKVMGKQFEDALEAFANLFPQFNEKTLRSATVKSLNQSLFQARVSRSIISRDGRTVGKRVGIPFGEAADENFEDSVCAQMVTTYGRLVDMHVRCMITPALEILLSEHRFFLGDFVTIAEFSPLVPHDRAELFGKGLYAGFEHDFITALYLLVPQVENLVRWHLKNQGIKTTTLDAAGVEMEVGLSTLLEKEEVSDIFGEDLRFELEALFTHPFGPNLRNAVAHGLLTSDESHSVFSIYVWWWCWRIVLKSYLFAQRQAP